jgi:4-diphosphocytidyl-2-C-methyl-D-erythritol kinase
MLIVRAHAKLNICLKITGTRGDMHEICSRFVRYDKLYDELFFVPKDRARLGFEISGVFGCDIKDNTIYKAYKLLQEVNFRDVDGFFQRHSVHVRKQIPTGGGLGGGSSDAAAFLLTMNNQLELGLSPRQLLEMGAKIGSDVAFFLSERRAANVSGTGEIISAFDDDIPKIELVFTKQHCNTGAVYREFRAHHMERMGVRAAEEMMRMTSRELLASRTPDELNDLLAPVLTLYPKLANYSSKGFFLSGSGGTFFKVKE